MSTMPTYIRILARLITAYGMDWIDISELTGGPSIVEWDGDYTLMKLTVSWTRTPVVGVVQDPDMCTFHFLNLTGGDPDDTWTTTDFTNVESRFTTFWNAIKDNYPGETKLQEYIWRADGPRFRPHGEEFSPTLRITPAGPIMGGGSTGSVLPPQCAVSVTERTAAHYTAYGVGVPGHAPGTGRTQLRNRWGRFYLPAPAPGSAPDGRWSSTFCTAISAAVKTFYDGCVSQDLIPVVYSPTTGNSWSIDEIAVDDIVDVLRSRRYTTPVVRAVNTIDAP